MKYKIGDVVRIQSKEWFDAQEKDEEGIIYKDNISFVEDMPYREVEYGHGE